MDKVSLVAKAIDAREFAYVPYSNFKVGAALLAKSGKIYNGCNIESASYTPTCCAERTAFLKAVSEGEREFVAIAVVGGYNQDLKDYCYPCGVCRQVMMDFCDPNSFKIIVAKDQTQLKEHLLKEILPYGFGPDDLK